MLLSMGIKKGDKVAILLMNCLEWLPIYFGVLKTGALAVPLNYRYAAEEIKYCLELADVDLLIFGPEFIERVSAIKDNVPRVKNYIFVGNDDSKAIVGSSNFTRNGIRMLKNTPTMIPYLYMAIFFDFSIEASTGIHKYTPNSGPKNQNTDTYFADIISRIIYLFNTTSFIDALFNKI